MLTFEMTLIFLYERWPLVSFMLPQIICRYTTFPGDITKSSKQYFNVCDLEKKWCFACKADFWNAPYFFYMNA